jgi:hypothetical protein
VRRTAAVEQDRPLGLRNPGSGHSLYVNFWILYQRELGPAVLAAYILTAEGFYNRKHPI